VTDPAEGFQIFYPRQCPERWLKFNYTIMLIRKFVLLVFCILFIKFSEGQLPFICDPKSPNEQHKYDSMLKVAIEMYQNDDYKFKNSSYRSQERKQEVTDMLLEWTEKNQIYLPKSIALSRMYLDNLKLKILFEAGFLENSILSYNVTDKNEAIKLGIYRLLNYYKRELNIARNPYNDNLIKLAEENRLNDFIKLNFGLN
jgi:hypothetical protein